MLSKEGSLDFKRLEMRVNGEWIKCNSAAGEPVVGRVVVALVLYQRWESGDGTSVRWRWFAPEMFRRKVREKVHGGISEAISA